MGVGMNATGNSLVVLNGQTTYQTWEFLYDPRVEVAEGEAGYELGAGIVGHERNGANAGVLWPDAGRVRPNARRGIRAAAGRNHSKQPGGHGQCSGRFLHAALDSQFAAF